MRFKFEWNDMADQPHNVAPRSDRTRHHLRRWPSYLELIGLNLVWDPAIFWRYRALRRRLFRRPVDITPGMFGLAVSPRFGRPGETDAVLALLRETGVRRVLFRFPSWERDRLEDYSGFAGRLHSEGFEPAAALLQRREDVFAVEAWTDFAESAFDRLGPACPYFEIGHAWNRTKWGVWDHREYIRLARAAAAARDRIGRKNIKLIGPAVIDFEYHLYPPVLRAVDFDVISSLLYVDRVGAPENPQYGFTAAKKIAFFRACADVLVPGGRPAWITEFNWPLENTGAWSPAAGKPNVGEDVQADFLVRYYIIALAGGVIDRAYWWQLVAPGSGLVDSRESPWRKRPSYAAFAFMASMLSGSVYTGKEETPRGGGTAGRGGEVYHFRKGGREFALAWTRGGPLRREFDRPVASVLDRSGRGLAQDRDGGLIRLDGSPRYVIFK